jgi:protein arginine N-methyltransferase 5
MMTVPITTSHFHSRVLGLLSSYLADLQSPTYDDAIGTMATTPNTRPLVVPSLSTADSYLTPNDATSQLVGVTSTWIDLCSPDPLIADLSRQVLMLEVAYAAFCGIGYLLIPGPKLHHGALHSEGVLYYARAVQDALNLGPYIQFHIWLQMVDNPEAEVDTMGDLAPLAREEYSQSDGGASVNTDPFGTWEAWDSIRKTCKYHTRLFVGMN